MFKNVIYVLCFLTSPTETSFILFNVSLPSPPSAAVTQLTGHVRVK